MEEIVDKKQGVIEDYKEFFESLLNSWNPFLNKNINLIYDDGGRYPSKKLGKLVSFNQTHLILEINNSKEAILISRILRVEERNGNSE